MEEHNSNISELGSISSMNPKNTRLRWQIGLETDIGGGKENQDESFVWYEYEFMTSERGY